MTSIGRVCYKDGNFYSFELARNFEPFAGLLSFSPIKQPFHCGHRPSGPSSGSFLIAQPCWSNTLDISDVGWNVSLDVAWHGWFEVKMLLLFGTFWDIPVMRSDTYHVHECLGKGTCKMKIQNCLQVRQILMISWEMFWSFFVRLSARETSLCTRRCAAAFLRLLAVQIFSGEDGDGMNGIFSIEICCGKLLLRCQIPGAVGRYVGPEWWHWTLQSSPTGADRFQCNECIWMRQEMKYAAGCGSYGKLMHSEVLDGIFHL